MKWALWVVEMLLCMGVAVARVWAESGDVFEESVSAPTEVTSLEQEIEAAIREVQLAEEAVQQAVRDVQYSDPECSKLKAELVEMERRVISLRQQLYAAVRASDVVRQAEERRRAAALRLQELRKQQARSARESEPSASEP